MKRCFCLVLLLLALTAKAQRPDSLFQRLAGTLALHDTAAHTDLFLHLDKTLYAAGENIWFAAYLTQTGNGQPHHTLHVTLLDEMAQRVLFSSHFVLEQGLASGNIALPDSLRSGPYCLVAYTNASLREHNPHIFRQPLTIVGVRQDPFALQITGSENGAYLTFTGQLRSTEAARVALPATLSLTIMADGKPYQQLEPRLDALGAIRFEVPATLADKTLEIRGTIKSGKEQMAFKRPLTWTSTQPLLTFFVPSARLIAGQRTQVALTARTTAGQAIAKRCALLENETAIAFFSTDEMGSGVFSFTPTLGKQYVVKFVGENQPPRQRFPVITTAPWDVYVGNTVVRDTLHLVVTTPRPATEGLLAIHNTRAMLFGAYLRGHQAQTVLKIPVSTWPPGVAYVDLYAKDGTRQERRLVLVTSPAPVSVALRADAATYRPLSEVTLKVKLTTSTGEPLKGVFSFSTCLEQALTSDAKNIGVYTVFERFLADRILLPPAAGLKTDPAIQSLLLRQELLLADSTWTSWKGRGPDKYDGYVLHNAHQLKKPVELLVLGRHPTLVRSDSTGRFALPYQALRVEAGKKVTLSVVAKNPVGYTLRLTSPWEKSNAALAAQPLLRSYVVPDDLSSEQKQQLAAPKNVLLQEVVVTAKKTDSGSYYGKANSSGVCLDYVCQFDVLNCPYHPGVKSPQEGQWYNLETPSGITKVVYHCQSPARPAFTREVPAIVDYTPFTPFSPSALNSPATLSNTTLHWQAFVTTNQEGEATIRFYTNARPGRYKAVVQGTTGKATFSSDLSFEVKP